MTSIDTIGVIGSGQMGSGIAQTAAQSGLSVLLLDVDDTLSRKACERIATSVELLAAKGKIPTDDVGPIVERIRPGSGLEELSTCDFAIEAVPEKQELKTSLMQDLDRHLPEGRILASNTSSISITFLAARTSRPERTIGMHFMNPVPRMQLVEIVPGLQTSPETITETQALGERFGKTTIQARDIPGFIVNRILVPMLNEAITALYEGLGTPEDIDTACKLGLNHPMGPLALADLIGLDTCLSILEVLHRELGEDRYRPSPLLRQYVAAGWVGKKSGRGFYTYA